MKTPVFVALLLLLGTASCQQNLFNSASSGGALLVLETSGYDGSVGPSATLSSMPYRGSTLENDCSASWYPNGSFCNDAVEIDNPDLSVRTNTHAGSTWSTPLANNPDNIGTMVVDAGSDVTITDFSIFQMFSDGKATHVSISVLNGSGPPVASPNLYQDPNWNVILPTSFIEAGQNLGSGVVSDPTKFTIPSVTGRYFLFEVSNDGTHGFASWIELRHVKAFNLFVAGGGGDPHLWAPALQQPRFDLAVNAAVVSARSVGAFDITLIQSSDVTVTGHVRASPLNGDKFYFTSFAIETEEDEAILSFNEEKGIALASLLHCGGAASCSSASEHTAALGDRAFLALHCSDAEARAARSAFETSKFHSHIPFVTASFDLETADFVMEFFFVQKQGPSFGFFDFSVEYRTDDILEGIFTNQAARKLDVRDGISVGDGMLATSRKVSELLGQHVSFVE